MYRCPGSEGSLPTRAAVLATIVCVSASYAQEASITVQADQPGHRISRYLTGACIEDVNHEIYGGIYSQMVFGESFQEPPPSTPPKGFQLRGGRWSVENGVLSGSAGDGPILVSELPSFDDGEIRVELRLPDRKPGNAGLIVRLGNPGVGANNFDGYEVSLDAAAQIVRLGRHCHDWQLIQDVPCEVPDDRWILLAVRLRGSTIEVLVDGRPLIQHDDGSSAILTGTVGLAPVAA